jgi:hypothetical protein
MALPEQQKNDVALLRGGDYGNNMGTPPGRLAGWAFALPPNVEGCAKAMLEVRDGLGNDALGHQKFVQVLETAQQVTLKQYDPEIGNRAQAAFALDVANGAIGPDDGKALVDAQIARLGGDTPNAKPKAIGEEHAEMTRSFAQLSSYVDKLGHDDKSNAVRAAFAHECIDRAIALRENSPAISAELYADAANAFADMPAAQVKGELADIARKDGPQGIAHFAAGAAAGEAARAKPQEVPAGRYELRSDGLANVMNKVNGLIEQGQQAGKPDALAESMGGQMFTGTTAFLNAARGTDLDHNLNDFDARTGLRGAMNGTMRANFPAVVRQNAQPDGEGLVAPNGFDTFSAYSRFECGAPNDEHGRLTANEFSQVMGHKLGTMTADVLKSERDGGADLRRDFGAGTFGDRAHEQGNTAMILGELTNSMVNGARQDFDVRAARSGHDQTQTKEGFESMGKMVSYAGKAAGEELAPVFEGASKVFDALANATPQRITSESAMREQFEKLEGSMRSSFAQYRPNENLVVRLADGSAHANTEWNRYTTQRDEQKTIDAQRASQEGALAGFLAKKLVPTPDDPAKPAPHQEMAKGHVADKTAEAVEKYNATHREKLPKPTEVAEWNGTPQKGVVLQLGPEDYAISTATVTSTPSKPTACTRSPTNPPNSTATARFTKTHPARKLWQDSLG